MGTLKQLYEHRKTIIFLSRQQIKKRYMETAFGMGWAIMTPMVFMFSFWYFFKVGIRDGSPVDGFPYLLLIFSAYMPWFFMSETITSGSSVIKSNAVLVKTINFPVLSLPLINVLSKLFVHVVVMLFVFIIFVLYGGLEYLPDLYYINFIYYWITMIAFFTALTIVLSSLNVVIRDVAPLVKSIMQPLFWITPVLYHPEIGSQLDRIMRLVNPLYYFVVGYKETMLYEKFFFEDIMYDIYIWLIIVVIYMFGMKLWKKVRPIMPDLI